MPEPTVERNAALHVVDSEHLQPERVFDFYYDMLQSGPVPWTPRLRPKRNLAFHFESTGVGAGLISSNRCTTHVAEITRSDISKASKEYFIFGLPLSGTFTYDQAGRHNVVEPGDLFVYDTARRIKIVGGQRTPLTRSIVVAAPKDAFATLGCAEDYFSNARIPREKVLPPLAQCLNMIVQHLRSATQDELTALYNACVSLLPVAVGCYPTQLDELEISPSNVLHREIIKYVDDHLSDGKLSPVYVAQALGISDRYIHKLFARSGMTFSAYVKNKRLDRARLDLLVLASSHYPVAAVAHRWGFSDLSTFYRAFTERFRCTPHEFRSRHR